MIFNCWSCKQYRFQNKKTGSIVITNSNGDPIGEKKICGECYDAIDAVYEKGMKDKEAEDKFDEGIVEENGGSD